MSCWQQIIRKHARAPSRARDQSNFIDAFYSNFSSNEPRSGLTGFRDAIYDNEVHVSFQLNALPVLYLLLYGCIHWRQGAADLRLI